ncbi:MAG TPA: hypothetical protein VF508_00200, partial [Pyrinomonadaceae bacterium]
GGAATAEHDAPPDAPAPAARKAAGQKRKKPDAAAPPAEEVVAPAPAPEVTTHSHTAAAPGGAAAAEPAVDDAPILVEPLPVEAVEAPAPPPKAAEPEIIILTTLADETWEDFRPRAAQNTTAKAEPVPSVTAQAAPVDAAPANVEAPAAAPEPKAEILETPFELAKELYLTLIDDEGEFRAGQLVTIKVYVGRGAYGRRPEPGAEVTVKVLGTSFRPLILTAATDAQGVGVVRALLPRFTSGRAAIIIRAAAGEDAAEMRRIIHQ